MPNTIIVRPECIQHQKRIEIGQFGLTALNPHVWGLYIASFIFWIGMSHSGTLLSAILHIIHADWRKPIYHFAEAMTTFSMMTAGLFVMVHLGRLWKVYYALPYPSERWIWPSWSGAMCDAPCGIPDFQRAVVIQCALPWIIRTFITFGKISLQN